MQDKDIKPIYTHTKLGNFLFFICAKLTKLLVKARWFYYFLAFTWGFLLTFLGLLITIILLIIRLFNKNIHFERYYWIYDIKAGHNYWGGFEMGLMFVRDQMSIDTLNVHEFGHTFQNCLFGPLMLFIISIPSAIRYWYQEIRSRKGKENKPHDSIWFEDAATQCGQYTITYFEVEELLIK